MNKRIVYTRPDGGVSVVVPAPKARREGETDDQFIERIRPKDVPDVAVCDVADIPSDRTFRNAWVKPDAPECWPAGAVAICKRRAHGLQMDRIRIARDAQLRALDIEYQRADERGDAAAKREIAERKQHLRDIPQTFDLSTARTPEELAAMWPDDPPRPG